AFWSLPHILISGIEAALGPGRALIMSLRSRRGPFIALLHKQHQILRCLIARYNLDRTPLGIDLHAGNSQACSDHIRDGAGYVALAEAGWPTGHGRSSKLSPSGPNAGLFSLR